ncbi:MAG: ATP-binding protein [Nostoc sp.]
MFKKATKSQIKIRLALSGASGSGKTYSALAIAQHLGDSIALIDTEHGSASRYADRFTFDTCELKDHHPAKYIEAIKAAESAGYEVIIIDSLSHAWFSELELAGKGFDGWKNVRPLERKLIDAMIGSSSHIIATMRSKTEWIMEEYSAKDGKTKQAPKKIGTAPIQSSGIEYEFDLAGELDYNHILTISKSRCPELSDKTFLNPGKDIADTLKAWIGQPQPAPPWKTWKSEEDAIIWASQQLPDWDLEEIRTEFSELKASNGKKAPAWVDRVMHLKERF